MRITEYYENGLGINENHVGITKNHLRIAKNHQELLENHWESWESLRKHSILIDSVNLDHFPTRSKSQT